MYNHGCGIRCLRARSIGLIWIRNTHPSTTLIRCAHRHLGIMLDSRLSYSAHIEGVTSRFWQRVVLLSYMAKYLSRDIVNKPYKGFVRPVVEYSSPLWHSRLTTHQSLTLERLQVPVARQLLARLGVNRLDGYRTSNPDLLDRVRWPSLTWRRHIDSMRASFIFFFRGLPTKLLDFGFVLSNSSRRQGSILLPTGTSFVRSTVLYTAARCWNALSPDIRCVEHPKQFLYDLKLHFEASCYNTSDFLHT